MKAADVNEIRARLQAIVGQAQALHLMLGDVAVPEKRLPAIDHSTNNVCRELQRLSIVLAVATEMEKNNAARMCSR